jgi:BirA family transcriptional regulator, biotin operon repressor / biotin---[acetyl-CoA-carboxylase] ligase
MNMIRTIPQTASTNEDVMALATAGAGEGLWLRAEQQTGGRGRLGRGWVSPPGNLYVSTLIRLQSSDPAAATLGFVAAVALHEIAARYAPDSVVQIKWPNDVMANGAKLSGILLERTGDAVVVGIGVNMASHPELADRKTTCLAALTGTAPDPSIFLEELREAFQRHLSSWRGDGLHSFLHRWRAAAHSVGTALRVSLPEGTAIDADGAVRVIHAGDVFLV